MTKKLLVLGAKGTTKKALEILAAKNEYAEIALLDNYPDSDSVFSYPIIGKCDDIAQFRQDYSHAFVCIAGSDTRQNFLRKVADAGYEIPNIIHPLAYVSPSAKLGRGVLVDAFAAIQSDCVIGDGCMINTGAIIEHDNVLGACVTVTPNAVTAGNVTIGSCSFLGINSCVINEVRIGENALVAAGAVVICNLPGNVMAAGCPAVVKKEIQEIRFRRNQKM